MKKLKYYIYLSDSKISMLHAQLPQAINRTSEASLGFDVKLLKGHIRQSSGIPQNSLTRLAEVVRRLYAAELVGSIAEPKQYIAATLTMRWSTYDIEGSMDRGKSPITFWGYCEQRVRPFAGTVLALAGSKYHLLGHQREGFADSASLTTAMTLWFLENLGDPFGDPESLRFKAEAAKAEFPKKDVGLTDYDIANGAWLAAIEATGVEATYEFLAKVLHKSDWPDGFRGDKTTIIILGSPLYVTIAE